MLLQTFQKVTQNQPDAISLVYGDQKLSYQDLHDQILAFAKGLQSIGIKKGDCVALLLPNCPEFVIGFYAIAGLNAILLPLNHLFKPEEIAYYLKDSNAKAVVTDQKRIELCASALEDLNSPVRLISINPNPPTGDYFYTLLEFGASTSSHPELIPVDAEKDFLYQYSSGSTGRPKRVGRTQKNLHHEQVNFAQSTQITPQDNILCLVPMYHAHGLGNCLLAATGNGAKLVILEQPLDKQGCAKEVPFVFRRLRVLELIAQESITILPAVPYILGALAETPLDFEADLSSLRLCFSAGNFLSREIFDAFFCRFQVLIRQLYGCTEAGSIAINLDDNLEPTWNAVGQALKNVSVQILDETEQALPPGSVGEVVIASGALTQGYHNMPELNQQAFKQGRFYTGDLGKVDESGHLYITGRKKILIDTGGRKVDPIEVEDVLLSHRQVKEAVVVGSKDEVAGEIVKAVIVPRDMKNCDSQDILVYCQAKLAEFKVPKIIEFREEIPKSPLGKILRKALV
ncbi:MAG: acyl--CoA ligase [Leptolyngbya sp. SIO1D8]|nr:acyl--CoA ligase [Leptolyngbya sp. SIO1D8]